MVTYLMLLNWTDQEIRSVNNSLKSSNRRWLLGRARPPFSTYTAISN